MKKLLCLLFAVSMSATLLGGCAGRRNTTEQPDNGGKEGKIAISMYMWDRSMFKELTPWLEQKFPEIEFTFVQSYNTMEYYKDLLARGEPMPDIITCRRFSLNDASPLAQHLMDLSQTEVAGTFYSSYLEVNRENSGAIRWLPMCAEVDSIMANKDLFDQYNIPLPTNYAEFLAAINAFEALGIKGFQTDWKYDYTCLETMQGCAIPELMSLEGTKWRMEYESETANNQVGLDDQVWPKVFEKYAQFLTDVHFQPDDEELAFHPVTQPYLDGQTAMIRATAAMAESFTEEEGITSVILPYFGETSQDNWVLTYPMCQLAVSRRVEKDEAKKNAVMEVLMAIFSEEGQKAVAAGASVLSYNKEVSISPSPALQYAQDCIDSNHLYMRLASTEVFAISQDVAHKMMRGEYDARGAYEDFNAQLINYVNPESEEVLFTQENAYSNDFGVHGSAAASSLMNTLRAANGEQIAIGYASVVSSPIFAGDYTMQQIQWVMTYKNDAYRGEYTGAEIRRIMDWLVNVKEDGSNPIRHRNQMPVTSGLEYTVIETERGKFTLGDITVNGKPLEDDTVYTVLLVGADTYLEHPTFCNCPMPEDLKAKREDQYIDNYTNYDCITDALAITKQLLEPTEYVTILQDK
ncbi:5'-nucleotidase C-terminal domain-containing protein [Pseudoflavonifractor phocaeensis]|uniref:5'-nucleotidase C-terminal domain-containing protein n=1 Tax=Pseudoflavonifractor phocaeensis TaxID=1870988 RepID=UPI001F29A9C3|nr:5'-nucleotidase C-terminal domain-containing protein [Pseudoflavonifractor phocaeensis]MCF2595202.1 extracellular solute-binding protein [Pseudoflavonifractor phocaeensis]